MNQVLIIQLQSVIAATGGEKVEIEIEEEKEVEEAPIIKEIIEDQDEDNGEEDEDGTVVGAKAAMMVRKAPLKKPAAQIKEEKKNA